MSNEVDFTQIAPRGGSQDRAFEEFCCQIAVADVPAGGDFRRVRGDGGDGGVECMWTSPTGDVHGWQVKYIMNFGRALKKSAESLAAARKNHKRLSRYVICLPFDLSGSRGKGGKSEQDKFDAFKASQEADAKAAGQPLSIELWSAFSLRDRLLAIDASGGRTRYWFHHAALGADWFSAHVRAAIVRAGPRYNPVLHYGHVLNETLAALGKTAAWRELIAAWHLRTAGVAESWARALAQLGARGAGSDPYPSSASASGGALLDALTALLASLRHDGGLSGAHGRALRARQLAVACELELAADIDVRFGEGKADSVPFRQFQAEYQCCFPARHLDECREIVAFLDELAAWLSAPAIRASEERLLIVTGPAGIGKTHGLCDAAVQRNERGQATILVSGGQFSSERTIWESLAAAVGLDSGWTRDILLDSLDSAAASAGSRAMLCIDALDERAQRHRWIDDLPEMIKAVHSRPNLSLCVSVRDGYIPQVVRADLSIPVFEHPGFGDAVFDACSVFFTHFGLEPPVGPLLEPEFANPLFLLILCQTLRARKLSSIPSGWRGTRGVLGSLLQARDAELSLAVPAAGSRVVTTAMESIAAAMPDGGTLSWRDADRFAEETLPQSQRGKLGILERLVALGLLRVLPGEVDGWSIAEDRVDIGFGRLRHHLLADRMTAPSTAATKEALRDAALHDPGLAEALALVMPERGLGEVIDLASSGTERRILMEAWVAALPWREGSTLGRTVSDVLLECLRASGLTHPALDAMLTLALRPGTAYDHRYFHDFWARLPMPHRDGGLCWYLHKAFDRTSPPSPLVRALRAPWESELCGVSRSLREAWSVVLCWCGAAADRRVRDTATKALVRLTEGDPGVWPAIVDLFADVDDDAVLERVLCSAYGAVLRNPEAGALLALSQTILAKVLGRSGGMPHHALIRGHARGILEWAAHRGVLPPDVLLATSSLTHGPPASIEVPSAEALEQYDDQSEYPQLYLSIMSEWTGDFAKYTVPFALGENTSLSNIEEAYRWILGEVISMGYEPDLHADYDREMLRVHGPGRGRPEWAERIGKKYQHIALARLVGRLDDIAHAKGESRLFAGRALRDLDPSLFQSVRDAEVGDPSEFRWWAPTSMDFRRSEGASDKDWVGGDDFPDPSELAGTLIDPGSANQKWRLLEAYYSWSDRNLGERPSRYRDVWMMIKGYLVPRKKLAACVNVLAKCDFMGRWMHEGFYTEASCYMGEYPWSPFFPELREPSDAWRPEAERVAKFGLRPVANRVTPIEDSWHGQGGAIMVPSAELVAATRTRWDGRCGFKQEDGTVVFQDPSSGAREASGLWIDDHVLEDIQGVLDVGVVWTVLAERRVVGDSPEDFCGVKHISLVMWLDGSKVRVRRARGHHVLPDLSRVET